MEDLNTYNRVQSLETLLLKNMLVISHAVLLPIILLGSISLLILENSWPYTFSITLSALLAYLSLSTIYYRRSKRCRYCRRQLDYVIRPLLLTSKYLSLQGNKKGDYFFTRCRWGSQPFTRRWVKISNRSLTCHHCRLSEKKQTEHYQSPSAKELANIDQR